MGRSRVLLVTIYRPTSETGGLPVGGWRGFLRGWKTPPIVIDEVFVEDSRDIPVPKFEYVEDEPIIDRGNFSGFASF